MTDQPRDPITILLVDDHPAVRQGLHLLFSRAGYRICGEAETVAETTDYLTRQSPDLVLLDISLDQENGFDLLPLLAERNIKVIVYSMHSDAASIEKAFKLGANGYVTKRDAIDALLEAVQEVRADKRHISRQAAKSLADKLLSTTTQSRPEDLLSHREQEIAGFIRKGYTTAEIALNLSISPRTVESYYTRITEKFGLGGMKSLRRHLLQGSSETGT